MVPWLVAVFSLWMLLQFNSAIAENFTDEEAPYEDYEDSLVACPNVIKVEWNELLSREPHVIKNSNGTENSYEGLFPRKLYLEELEEADVYSHFSQHKVSRYQDISSFPKM